MIDTTHSVLSVLHTVSCTAKEILYSFIYLNLLQLKIIYIYLFIQIYSS